MLPIFKNGIFATSSIAIKSLTSYKAISCSKIKTLIGKNQRYGLKQVQLETKDVAKNQYQTSEAIISSGGKKKKKKKSKPVKRTIKLRNRSNQINLSLVGNCKLNLTFYNMPRHLHNYWFNGISQKLKVQSQILLTFTHLIVLLTRTPQVNLVAFSSPQNKTKLK